MLINFFLHSLDFDGNQLPRSGEPNEEAQLVKSQNILP